MERRDIKFEQMQKHYEEMAKDRAEVKNLLNHRVRQEEQKNFIWKTLAEHALGRAIEFPSFAFDGVTLVEQDEDHEEQGQVE